jgi:hypothetical protein
VRILVVIAVSLIMGATPIPPDGPEPWNALSTATAGVQVARREDHAVHVVRQVAEASVWDLVPDPPRPPPRTRPASVDPPKLLALARTPRASQGPPAQLL